MPRIRTLKPELFVSSQVMNVSRDARLLFIGLITQADDDGRGVADPRKLKAVVFPGDEDISRSDIEQMLAALAAQQLITLYASDHGDLYALPSWGKHQKISKYRPSVLPPPPRAIQDDSRSPPGELDECSNGKGSEGKGSEQDLIKDQGSDLPRRSEEEVFAESRPNGTTGLRVTRRHAPFEEVNEAVYLLIHKGACKSYDISGIASAANISQEQARIAVRQLRDRGRLGDHA